MKRKCPRRKNKLLLSKKNVNSTIDNFFKSTFISNNHFKAINLKKNISPFTNSLRNASKKLYIIRNPSKTKIYEETQQELKKFHDAAGRTILCDYTLIDNLYTKINPYLEKIEKFLSSYKNYNIKNINKKGLITKFILQLKYTDIIYLSPSLLSETFNEDKIAQKLKI